MSTRRWYLNQALASYPSMKAVLNELTLEEIIAALDLESRTLRRKSILTRLISRAVRLNEIEFKSNLEKKYHGKST